MPGRDVFSDAMPIAYNMSKEWKTDLGSYEVRTVNGTRQRTFVPVNDSVQIPANYVATINAIVSKKVQYNQYIIGTSKTEGVDYFGHLYDLGLLK